MNTFIGREDERAAVLLVGLQRLDTGRADERVTVHFCLAGILVTCALCTSTRCTALLTDTSQAAGNLVHTLSHYMDCVLVLCPACGCPLLEVFTGSEEAALHL